MTESSSPLESKYGPVEAEIPSIVFGDPVDLAVMQDFENEEIPGLVWRCDREPFVQDDSYGQWYRKSTWGDFGGGIYAYLDKTDATEKRTDFLKNQGHEPHVTALRVSAARYFDATDESVFDHKISPNDELLDRVLASALEWQELSGIEKMSVIGKSTEQRFVKSDYFKDLFAKVQSIKSTPPAERSPITLNDLRHLSKYIFPASHVAQSPDELGSMRRDRYAFGTVSANLEIFSLLLRKSGFDGVYFLHNSEHPTSVTWNTQKIGNQDVWFKRLTVKD